MKRIKPHIHIEPASVSWRRIRGLSARLEAASAATLDALSPFFPPAALQARIAVLLSTDERVRTLNCTYRGIDRPTNVLSFPFLSVAALKKAVKADEALHAGDIVLAFRTTKKEARRDGKKILDHATHLVIHGILHLYGYDHESPRRASVMEKTEKEIMAKLGLPDPYEEI